MAIPSDGSYGIESGLVYSFPVTCEKGGYRIVEGLEISPFSRDLMDKSASELAQERDAVSHLLP
jgi:malate dehydrogenase